MGAVIRPLARPGAGRGGAGRAAAAAAAGGHSLLLGQAEAAAEAQCALRRGTERTNVALLSTTMAGSGSKVITLENMNSQVKKMEYAVRGPLVIRATAIEKELQAVSPSVCVCVDWVDC